MPLSFYGPSVEPLVQRQSLDVSFLASNSANGFLGVEAHALVDVGTLCSNLYWPGYHRCELLETDRSVHQVSLPTASAVQVLLARAALEAGHSITYRAKVSTFEAALRVVRAGLGISVVPKEVAQPLAKAFDLALIDLLDDWTKRRFAICFQDARTLPAAARLLAEYLAGLAKKT